MQRGRPKGQHQETELKAELIFNRFQEGKLISEIAAETGLGVSSVKNYLRQKGINRFTSGPKKRKVSAKHFLNKRSKPDSSGAYKVYLYINFCRQNTQMPSVLIKERYSKIEDLPTELIEQEIGIIKEIATENNHLKCCSDLARLFKERYE